MMCINPSHNGKVAVWCGECHDAMKLQIDMKAGEIENLVSVIESLQKDKDESNRLIFEMRTAWERFNRGEINFHAIWELLRVSFPDKTAEQIAADTLLSIKPKDANMERLIEESKALLDPNSPGWNEGAARLLKDLKDRKESDKRNDVVGPFSGKCPICGVGSATGCIHKDH